MSSVLRAPSGPLDVLDQTDNGGDQKESARYSTPPQKHQRRHKVHMVYVGGLGEGRWKGDIAKRIRREERFIVESNDSTPMLNRYQRHKTTKDVY